MTREGAETAADAIEEDNDKDKDFVNATKNYHEEVGKERGKENIKNIATSTCNTAVVTSKRNRTGKKMAKSFDHSSDLVEQLIGFQKAYQEATEEIKGIASFFKKEAEGTDRRLSLFSERKEVERYSKDELIMVGQYISKDSYKVDYFFALPKEYRKDYIRLQLNECNPSYIFLWKSKELIHLVTIFAYILANHNKFIPGISLNFLQF